MKLSLPNISRCNCINEQYPNIIVGDLDIDVKKRNQSLISSADVIEILSLTIIQKSTIFECTTMLYALCDLKIMTSVKNKNIKQGNLLLCNKQFYFTYIFAVHFETFKIDL